MATPCRILREHPDPDPPGEARQKTVSTEHTTINPRNYWLHFQTSAETWHPHNTNTNKQNGHSIQFHQRQLPNVKSGVYRIPYSCGKEYIGQIGCHISIRIMEHVRDTRLESQRSVVAGLLTATRHSIDFDKTEVAANVSSYCPCITRVSKAWLHLFIPKWLTPPGP